ncbi:hypothetical protein ACFW3D_38060 [Streptomyces sp. NPDC058864]
MSTTNAALAGMLDRRQPQEADQLLAAIIDFGVHVPVDGAGSVMFVGSEDEGPALPGYVSEACCLRRLPEAAAAVHCDGMRLLDIRRHTNVGALAVFSEQGRARVPFELLEQALRTRGQRTTEARTLRLTWSTRPTAVTLRDRLGGLLLDFPHVRCVWIAQARWSDTGPEHLMLHIALADSAPVDAESALMKALLAGVELGEGARDIAVRALDPRSESDVAAMRELDTLGLDTVRADHAARRVEVISREYDDAPRS